jgi:hypothetical protein
MLKCGKSQKSKTKGDTMNRKHCLSAMGLMLLLLLSALALFAQENPGTVAAIEFQKVKLQMVPQYEAGRKQKAAWHKQQNDTMPLLVWQCISGDETGTYLVGRFDQHWADFDKPPITDEADLAEFQKVVGNYVESIVTRYYNYLPKISNPDTSSMPTKFSEVLIFQVRGGKQADFRSAISRIYEGGMKTKWPVNYRWYELANGGQDGTFVLTFPHQNWADFEDHPDVKPYRDMIKEAFGQDVADSIQDRLDRSIEKITTEILQFRPDLSYIPGK